MFICSRIYTLISICHTIYTNICMPFIISYIIYTLLLWLIALEAVNKNKMRRNSKCFCIVFFCFDIFHLFISCASFFSSFQYLYLLYLRLTIFFSRWFFFLACLIKFNFIAATNWRSSDHFAYKAAAPALPLSLSLPLSLLSAAAPSVGFLIYLNLNLFAWRAALFILFIETHCMCVDIQMLSVHIFGVFCFVGLCLISCQNTQLETYASLGEIN